MKLSQIAQLLNGQLVNLREDIEIRGLKSINKAKKGEITFVADKKYLKDLQINASAVLTKEKLDLEIPQIIVDNPQTSFYRLIDIFYPEEEKAGISKKASISENVEIGENVYIGEFTVIEEGVKIGSSVKIYPNCYIGKNTVIKDNTVIYPNVVIYRDAVIGKNVIIHSGCVIGADGFGYYQENGKHKKIKHVGKVIIEDDVEIGANTTIDRAMVDETVIKKGTKIDNLVMIAHNCEIGENSIIVSQVGIAGSCKIGKNVILAGQVGVADHITIGDNVIVTAKSGVGKNLEAGKVYGSGLQAIEWSKWKKVMFYLYKLPEIIKKLK
ncbi:UDP-3-O-(3-hydroxymyristoyl)glucosamine N-acyltransferase [Persephonella atlantica]|uniref:UDP-3-O-acylglucosamine N-acyltransferase n=1 Tax=Persephonella atlantica TaxID=2699429 RepID=A0ABS1GI29_9AQUI|nr:UDP-3-O-(3-hydroxymyristoyl)glucosamine N-acyltransferase [Persephonella atlantica]MBK3332505.1 UDP-3-O-(3-hydroxymyristoyl)glucosamine N-acyltransferase [Persephonella atlantica]